MVGHLNRDKLIPYKSKQNNFDFFEKIIFKLPLALTISMLKSFSTIIIKTLIVFLLSLKIIV
jgi:hypothetical protein